MKVKRWTLEQIQKSDTASMLTDGKGAYVKVQDYWALEAANADLEKRLGEMTQIIISALSDEPLPDGTYYHLPFCSGSRDVPPGTPGYSCCCLPSKRKAKEQIADLEARLAKAEEREKVLVEAIKTATTNAKPTLGTTDMGSAVIRRMHYLYQMDDHLTLTKAALAGIPLLTGSENKGKAEEDKP